MSRERWMDRFLEISAVVLNLLFTVFYLNGSLWCYLFGVLGPLALLFLCYRKKLYAEPVLQLFYIGFAVYGYFTFGETWHVVFWPWSVHLIYILVGILASVSAGYFLTKRTDAKLPYADSVVTVFAVIGTWMMVNYVHESWLYLIAINAISLFIYLNRRLFIGAAMFLIYFIMSLDGYFELKIFYS